MKIFVGTMHSQEGEFDACCKRIKEQFGVEVTHFIVTGLNEKDAHNALWDEWNKQKYSHDLFVKVDADTILAGHDTLCNIAEQFTINPRLTGMQMPLYDYMTDDLINGLNAFSPAVIFSVSKDNLRCDRNVDTNHDVVIYGDTVPAHLIPAGHHCMSSTDQQAFHYGIHRALKNQRDIINKVRTAWHKHHDRARTLALLGAEMSRQFFTNQRFNYNDPEFIAAFDKAKHLLSHLLSEQ